ASTKNGNLAVRSKLVLKVFEGKTLLGSTPLNKSLSAGRHSLKLVHEQSGWSESRMVELKPEGLERLDVGSGTLRVNIQPFGNVRIGSFTGETPLAPVELPAGTHTVKLWNSELGKKENATVKVLEGKEATLSKDWR